MKNYEMKFNKESAYDNKHIKTCSPTIFKAVDSIGQTIEILEYRISPLKFKLIIDSLNIIVDECDMIDINRDYLIFYCENDPYLQVDNIEVENNILTVLIITT